MEAELEQRQRAVAPQFVSMSDEWGSLALQADNTP
jgi:hypothetical protein